MARMAIAVGRSAPRMASGDERCDWAKATVFGRAESATVSYAERSVPATVSFDVRRFGIAANYACPRRPAKDVRSTWVRSYACSSVPATGDVVARAAIEVVPARREIVDGSRA